MKGIRIQEARIYYETDVGLDGESYWLKVGDEEDDALKMYLLENGWLEVIYRDFDLSEFHPPHMVLWARGVSL